MPSKPESRFKDKVSLFLRHLPHTYYEKIQQVCIVGTPDFFAVVGGVAIVMELKAHAKTKVSALQRHNLQRAADAGALAIVACPENWDSVQQLLQFHSDQYGERQCLSSNTKISEAIPSNKRGKKLCKRAAGRTCA